MSDLIDRQETLDALDKRFESLLKRFDYNSYENADEKTKLVCDGLSEAEDVVMGLPSALSTNLAEVGTDAVSRKAVKELAYSQIRSMYCGVALKEQRETMLRIADNVIGLLAPVTSAQPATSCSEIPNGSDDTISRQAAIDALGGNEPVGDPSKMDDDDVVKMWERIRIINIINKLPSAQPDIIRCRNCKFASGDSRICMKLGHSPIGELDFCAWAERRTDG